MTKFSIPAFVENLAQDTENAKYSKAKLKIYYVGETVDKRLFTKEFSDMLLSTIAYTPVVGFYSVADEDFVGHNNVQHIYGLVPADSTLEYVEDAEKGVTFAVTDILLYTGRPDEIGTIAAKIVGKQHSLELDPKTVEYKINRDEEGNFKNLEFIKGELIGLSVLGDNDKPAFSGSEFFSAEELPEFITEENRGKYQALFNTMFNIEPTAEEVMTEIYQTLERQRIYGYVCEHMADKYVVICSDYGVFGRYTCSRDKEGKLVLTFDCNVRSRYLSDEELESLTNVQKGSLNDDQTQSGVIAGAQTDPGVDPAPSVDDIVAAEEQIRQLQSDLEACRSDNERLTEENGTLTTSLAHSEELRTDSENAYKANTKIFKEGILQGYKFLLSAETIADFEAKFDSMAIDEFIAALAAAHAEAQAAQSSINDVIEITTIDDFATYNELDETSVVKKYLKR